MPQAAAAWLGGMNVSPDGPQVTGIAAIRWKAVGLLGSASISAISPPGFAVVAPIATQKWSRAKIGCSMPAVAATVWQIRRVPTPGIVPAAQPVAHRTGADPGHCSGQACQSSR